MPSRQNRAATCTGADFRAISVIAGSPENATSAVIHQPAGTGGPTVFTASSGGISMDRAKIAALAGQGDAISKPATRPAIMRAACAITAAASARSEQRWGGRPRRHGSVRYGALLAAAPGRLSMPVMTEAVRSSLATSAMCFSILICAQPFALHLFRLGGEGLVQDVFAAVPGSLDGQLLLLMLILFVLGFFFERIEISYIALPMFLPVFSPAASTWPGSRSSWPFTCKPRC